ncbi:DNA/RNA non-specific endonuclease [Massilimicrobiota sp. An142]|uniref:DNA/RNA non-specific endonuclease n=1 Tax=Massilimicrobiota sp. An142 TaxID=1965564 RepID=UPI00130211AF|nr:DNA/RNA non-specific endonuclease [Massilimicrobiota sp. An142]
MNRKKILTILMAIVLSLFITGCSTTQDSPINNSTQQTTTYSKEDIPDFDGTHYNLVLNNNETYFTDKERSYGNDYYSVPELDSLGRCGPVMAVASPSSIATTERDDIGDIKPSGWQTKRYDGIVSEKLGYVYNRSHLAMFKLFDNLFDTNVKENLITGTRFFNADDEYGMLHYENMALDYVYDTGNTLLYRVTPIFEGDNLVAKGVIMEAESLEDNGGGLEFCVFIYNVQPNVVSPDKPGIEIDYATGLTSIASKANTSDKGQTGNTEVTYILNTNSKKIHRPDCDSVSQMSQRNKKETNQSKEELIKDGYTPCQSCNP